MRLWLNDSERLPDPAQVPTDDRKPVIAGLILWLVALAAVLLAGPLFGLDLPPLWLWTCVTGLALGLLGLGYTVRRHQKR